MEIVNLENINNKDSYKETKNTFAKTFLEESLKKDLTINEFDKLFDELKKNTPDNNFYSFVGNNENNPSNIEVSTDPGRSLMERVTNAIDSVLELQYFKRNGKDHPLSPHDAAESWLGIMKDEGIKSLSYKERMALAEKSCKINIFPGNGLSSRIIDVIDYGIGINQNDFPKTILSISGSNKIRKKYVMGQYGQGGSSTFSYSKKTLIVSRHINTNHLSFTVVWYEEPDPNDEHLKSGNYRYFTENNLPISLDSKNFEFKNGTTIRHIGYDATKYRDAIGIGSIFGISQRTLFNPPIPFIINDDKDSGVHKYGRRSIVGARASLLGAVDETDTRTKVKVDYNENRTCIPISSGELGKIWVEYWLAAKPERILDKNGKYQTKENPINSLIDKNKPIIFTHNGQNQFEENSSKISNSLDLPFLKNRLIIHVDCNELKPQAKRSFFSSTREHLKETAVKKEIIDQVMAFVKADDELKRRNDLEAEELAKDDNTQNKEYLKEAVSKFLNLKTGDLKSILGQSVSKGSQTGGKSTIAHPKKPRIELKEIKLSDPPTYIKILGANKDNEISFYPTRERWIRIETDAHSFYEKNINFEISNRNDLDIISKSRLKDGRFRLQVKSKENSKIGNIGSIKVTLYNETTETNISDQVQYKITKVPEPNKKPNLPQQPDYKFILVNGKNDEKHEWSTLFDNDTNCEKYSEEDVSFHYTYNDGVIYVYCNTQFSNYVAAIADAQKRGGLAKVTALKGKYEIFLCALAYLDFNEKENNKYNNPKNIVNIVEKDDVKVQDLIRTKNNSAAASSLLLIQQDIFKKDA